MLISHFVKLLRNLTQHSVALRHNSIVPHPLLRLSQLQVGVSSKPNLRFQMEEAYKKIIETCGEDLSRPGLVDTPKRAAKAMQFLTRGYHQQLDEVINNALFPSDSREMVIVKDIELYSMCEHHLLPFIGKAHVAYIPEGKVLGLSKVARIVDMFARRLQIQEQLTTEIAETVQNVTGANGVGVIIEAKHMCMMMRGVQKQNSLMKTSSMLGTFRSNPTTRAEFLSLVTE